MRLQVLGPLQVVGHDGSPVRLRRRERALLSVLLLYARRPCAADVLALAVWGESQPRHPDSALRTCVSRIRAALPSGSGKLIVTLDGGYRADPPQGALDLDVFRHSLDAAATAARHGDRHQEADLLRQAVLCWNLPPGAERLPDMPDTLNITPFVGMLFELRRQAKIRLAEILLEFGMHDEVIPDLFAMTGADPGAEPVVALLMLALNRADRRAEAFDVYHRARRVLADQYGASPGPRLQAALTAILRQDEGESALPERAALPLPPPRPPVCPSGRQPMTPS
jgi:DNA-binding SARP family transcriptional activator